MLIKLGGEKPQFINPATVIGAKSVIWHGEPQYEVQQAGVKDVWCMTPEEVAPLLAYLEAQNANKEIVNNPSEWVLVSKQLPPHDGLVLVSCLLQSQYNPFVATAHYSGNQGKWIGDGGGDYVNYVTHWRTLPEPPKE